MYDWFIFASLFQLSVWFGNQDWSFLQWEKCLALGSILRCSIPVTAGETSHIVLLPSRIKDGVYIILLEFIPLHHVILPNVLLCSYELSTLDACWIAVDVWSNSSRCRIVSVYLSRMWCLYTWSCLHILITMHFSINCSTVICSPTVILMLSWEKPHVKPMALGSILHYIILPSTSYFCRRLFCNLYFASLS